MPLLTPFGVAIGVALPHVFIKLRPFIPWLFGTITLSGALKLRAREMGKAVSSPLPIISFFAAAHILMPFFVYAVSRLVLGTDMDTVSGYVLLYSAPTAVTAFIWIGIFRGDSALSLTFIMLDTILAPLVVPLTVRLLLGASLSLDTSGMALSLLYMILLPTVAGVALNEASRGKIPAISCPYLNPLSKICMVLVISANSAAVAPQLSLSNPRLLLIVPVCIFISSLGFVCGKLSGMAGKLGTEKQKSLFFATGLRNTSAAMTLGIEFFPPAAALPSVLGIVFQQTIAAIMGRVFFGKIDRRGDAGSRAQG